jgi:hypothetical protein
MQLELGVHPNTVDLALSVRVDSHADFIDKILALPEDIRPLYFTLGSRVRNKEKSLIANRTFFEPFLQERLKSLSFFDLVGPNLSVMILSGASRDSMRNPTHMDYIITVKRKQWPSERVFQLFHELCTISGVEFAICAKADEINHRHRYIIPYGEGTKEGNLGNDPSGQLPGLYWWTAFSEVLMQRHKVDIAKIVHFSKRHEVWKSSDGDNIYVFNQFENYEEWQDHTGRINTFLQNNSEFFSLQKIYPALLAAKTEEERKAVTYPYWTGSIPWRP